MKICPSAGCGRSIPDNRRLCDECKAGGDVRSHTLSDRERYRALYDSQAWLKLRRNRLATYPACQCDAVGLYDGCPCEGRCTSLARIIDHYTPAGYAVLECQTARGEDGKLIWPFNANAGFFLKCNLRSLCDHCHGHKTLNDKKHSGPWPSVVAMWREYNVQKANKESTR